MTVSRMVVFYALVGSKTVMWNIPLDQRRNSGIFPVNVALPQLSHGWHRGCL